MNSQHKLYANNATIILFNRKKINKSLCFAWIYPFQLTGLHHLFRLL